MRTRQPELTALELVRRDAQVGGIARVREVFAHCANPALSKGCRKPSMRRKRCLPRSVSGHCFLCKAGPNWRKASNIGYRAARYGLSRWKAAPPPAKSVAWMPFSKCASRRARLQRAEQRTQSVSMAR